MVVTTPYIGQRLSLKKQTCTVRYIGTVADKQGEWLGVEWDDTTRGKHDGTHQGTSYFKCRSTSPTAASFLRPKQPWDESRTLLQALREKYISPEDAINSEIVYISGKHAEEVGLEKLAKRQAQLQGIHALVLDRMCIHHRESDHEADQFVSSLCANITSLDLGGNLFESWNEVLLICRLFPRLSSLTLDGNRFYNIQKSDSDLNLPNIRYLGFTDTLLGPDDITLVTETFPYLQTLILANNEFEIWNTSSGTAGLPKNIHSIDLSGNRITNMTSLESLLTLPNLHTLVLKSNRIGSSAEPTISATTSTMLSRTLETLDLRSNHIATWPFISALPTSFPSLQNLHIASNPLYTSLTSADHQPLTPSDGYILTLGRLPQLQTLNHSTITDEQRLNADAYYFNQITLELKAAPPDQWEKVFASHPRWHSLSQEFDAPLVDAAPCDKGEIDPSTLAARFVAVTFYLKDDLHEALCDEARYFGEDEWTEKIPRSASIYALHGRVAKEMERVLPLDLKLVWETGERDPVRTGGDSSEAPEWWDSDDGEDGDGDGECGWVAREVELVAGTRMVGSYFEGREARVRVEARWEV